MDNAELSEAARAIGLAQRLGAARRTAEMSRLHGQPVLLPQRLLQVGQSRVCARQRGALEAVTRAHADGDGRRTVVAAHEAKQRQRPLRSRPRHARVEVHAREQRDLQQHNAERH